MPRNLTPIKRRDFIRRLRALGLEGPFAGGNHGYMVYGPGKLTIPSYDEFSTPMVAALLVQVQALVGRQVTSEDWARLGRRGGARP